MGSKIQLQGQMIGCWEIKEPAAAGVDESGTHRTSWIVMCHNCNETFKINTREIRRKLATPKDCPNCKTENKQHKDTIHHSLTKCSSRGPLSVESQIIDRVNCKLCLAVMSRFDDEKITV